MTDRISEERRREILENLRKERAARQALSPRVVGPLPSSSPNKFRSSTINKLIEEKRQSGEAFMSESNDQPSPRLSEILGRKSIDSTPRKSIDSMGKKSDESPKVSNSPVITDRFEIFESFPTSPIAEEVEEEAKVKPTKRELFPDSSRQPATDSSRQPPDDSYRQAILDSSRQPPRLKANAKKQKEEEQQRFKETHTFKPKITKLPDTKEHNYKQLNVELTAEERIDTLSKPRDIPKAEPTVDRSLMECTFQPNVAKGSSSRHGSSSRRQRAEPLDSWLHNEAEKLQAKLEAKKKAAEEETLEPCTFAPNIGSKKESRAPIHQRLDEVQKEKSVLLQKLRADIENEFLLTFQPELNERTQNLVEFRKDQIVWRGKQKRQQNAVASDEDYTFQPKIENEIYSETLEMSFFSRQKLFEEKQKINKEKLIDKDVGSYNFKPAINKNSEKLARTDAARIVEETGKNKFDRLTKEAEKVEKHKKNIEEAHYAQFDYRPEINEKSRKMAQATPLQELAFNPQASSNKRRLVEKVNHEIAKECSFKPVTNTNNTATSVYNQNSDITKTISQQQMVKEMQVDQVKQQNSIKELDGCTFKPSLSAKTPSKKPAPPVVIQGLEQFMANKERAEKLKQEKETRERELYETKYQYRTYTVPKPFALAPSKKDEKLKRAKEEQQLAYNKTHTFKPSTLESNNRAIVSKLLKE